MSAASTLPVDPAGASAAPTVSVVIPTYNWSSVLRYAIQTVLWQTWTDWELLVVGDACTDDSADVVASFGDPRIAWHNLAENSGSQSGPNNAALARARGRYVAYLGHDDVWHPAHLRVLLRAFAVRKGDVAFTQGVMIGAPGTGTRTLHWPVRLGRFFAGQHVLPSTMMHRREVAGEVGSWRPYRDTVHPPDFDFVCRLAAAGKQFLPVRRLTVFKFNASLRRNSYRDKPSHEQQDYVRRIQTEPDFLDREWQAIRDASARGAGIQVPDMPPRPDPLPPGWIVDQWRRIRGLPSAADKAA
jgi:glycosyltransferase involved in cell wall biosynthesis